MKSSKYYRTSDFGLAIILNYLHELKKIEVTKDKKGRAKGVFVFERTPDIDSSIKEYWNRQVRVEPQQFMAQMKYLKNRLYDSMK